MSIVAKVTRKGYARAVRSMLPMSLEDVLEFDYKQASAARTVAGSAHSVALNNGDVAAATLSDV